MSNGALRLLAGAGATSDPVYVDDVFSTFLYDGNGSTQNIVNGLDLSGEGGLVWIKARNQGYNHFLFDTARGASSTITADGTGAAFTTSRISSFNNNGFSLGTDDFANGSGSEYVAWSFRKQSGFFDVVTYSGTGSAQNISHNLGSVPGMIIVKNIGRASTYWHVYHRAAGGSYSTNPHNVEMYLNTTDNEQNGVQTWGTTAPTSTQFTIGGSGLGSNYSGDNYVAYLFAHDAQDFGEDSDEAIIKCGSFTTDGSGNASVDLGFEPQWILAKTSASANQWVIVDTMRGLSENGTGTDKHLWANSSNAEMNYAFGHPTATGFEAKNIGVNQTYIYVAIRRPHKPASEFAATELFKVAPRSNTSGADHAFVSNFPVDMGMTRNVLSGTEMQIGARLTGDKYLETPTADAEATVSDWGGWDSMNSVSLGFSKSAESPIEKYGWMFRRAPGFFDVVTYTGDSSSGTKTINHNLGVVPEMMWVKNRDASYNWWTAHTFTASNAVKQYPSLNGTQAGSTESYGTSLGLNAQPTSTAFVVNTDTMIGRNVAWVAYLFASVDGISKVGTYTGTGSDLNVDCGFSAGARFVLVKRTDFTGDWYVWDSERGIVAGDDPYLLLNDTAAQVTNTDYIDPLSSGFTITSSAPAALNTSGGTYIFLAIA